MRCPRCGSDKIETIYTPHTTVSSEERLKGFGFCKGCLGWLIFGPMGWLCGLFGMGKGKIKTRTQTTHEASHICINCGRRF